MSLIFGLAHAPGFIFRHPGAAEGLGANPTALGAVAYFNYNSRDKRRFLWRHLGQNEKFFALMAIHAAADVFPNLSDFVKIWL